MSKYRISELRAGWQAKTGNHSSSVSAINPIEDSGIFTDTNI